MRGTLGKMQQALDEEEQALEIYRGTAEGFGEAAALNEIGIVYHDLGQEQQALESLNQAMALRRKIGDRDGVAWSSTNIGNVEKILGQKQEALASYNQALGLFTTVGDAVGEAGVRNNLGSVYRELGEQQKALELYKQALDLYRRVSDLGGQAATLTNLGNVFYSLGDKQTALNYYKLALPVRRQVGNPAGEANTLNNIGAVYVELGRNAPALLYLQRALALRRGAGDRAGEAATLINLGNVDTTRGQKHSALAEYGRALELQRAIGDSGGEAGSLNNIGFVYDALGDNRLARDSFNQALPLATAVGDPIEEARVYCNLMVNLSNGSQARASPTLAIFYGKQGINLLQQVRVNLQGLDKALQKSFLASKEDYYHRLAQLLINESRLPEAEQVIDLLKQQEYSDYVHAESRGDGAGALSPVSLTPAEKMAQDEYERSTVHLVALGEQWARLRRTSPRTPEQEMQYAQIASQLEAASKGLNDYYERLYVLLGKDSGANRQVADVKGDVSLLRQAIARMPHTVALYTLVSPDRTNLILITPTATIAREYIISSADLTSKVVLFARALRDPGGDPRTIAHEMYEILVGPVKSDLDDAGAETIIWSLDGVLRYLPMAALHDGKRYLAESYNTATITQASIAHLAEKPDMGHLDAVAMGISLKYEPGLSALPSVPGELHDVVRDVVRDAKSQGATGVLPGTILLDGQFTEKAMERQLGTQHAVLHIASHFVFRPGDASQSYLLLSGKDEPGSGFHLTVADFRDNQNLQMEETDLLTLSACDTGIAGNASNGREVDGLGTTAQLKGARSVISSLWGVNDASTGLLMSDFYRRWAAGGGQVTKVSALRDAQLDLLLGRIKPTATAPTPEAGAPVNGMSKMEYSHPYFWAPFVLSGNVQ